LAGDGASLGGALWRRAALEAAATTLAADADPAALIGAAKGRPERLPGVPLLRRPGADPGDSDPGGRGYAGAHRLGRQADGSRQADASRRADRAGRQAGDGGRACIRFAAWQASRQTDAPGSWQTATQALSSGKISIIFDTNREIVDRLADKS
jgi:hypothetical protein